MNKKKIVISLIIVFVVVLVIPYKSEVEKEIEYYEGKGHDVYMFTVSEWYGFLPTELSTTEVEVTKEMLRGQVQEAVQLYGKDKVPLCYNEKKTVIWMLYVKTTPEGGTYGEVLFWEP